MILCTFWVRDALQCVLVQKADRLDVEVWSEDRPFRTGRVPDALIGAERAAVLYGVLCSDQLRP